MASLIGGKSTANEEDTIFNVTPIFKIFFIRGGNYEKETAIISTYYYYNYNISYLNCLRFCKYCEY